MNPSILAAALAGLLLCATDATAGDFDAWPTHHTFADGTDLSASLNFAYDLNDFSGDRGYGTATTTLHDDDGMRRREFGAALKKKGVYDATVGMDFETNTWLDVALRVETKALFGQDMGRIRVGYFKTPVGFESNSASRAGSLMENAAASQAVFEGRRTGVEWSLARPDYAFSAAYFFGHDLQGDNPGTTAAARAFWLPLHGDARVLHLGVAASVENPHGNTDGRSIYTAPGARFRARPQAGLTDVRLVDSGKLMHVDRIDRAGLEALWIDGPWSLQGEYLIGSAQRDDGLRDFTAQGGYVTGSWLLTGESRPYSGGNVANVKPAKGFGAVELLARYGDLDLNDAGIAGGRQRDITFGANWYLTSHFKFQANYVHVLDEKRAAYSATDEVELRAQVQF
ncbi:porin [Lysobacter sp. FW306-1B-D06B]|uniref:OprO/OprP family phosphate-selective porin n=1 Tax=Lysobacter sp. FW306-1B-D06B TaxID=3140250 RepID=UPI00314074ED